MRLNAPTSVPVSRTPFYGESPVQVKTSGESSDDAFEAALMRRKQDKIPQNPDCQLGLMNEVVTNAKKRLFDKRGFRKNLLPVLRRLDLLF